MPTPLATDPAADPVVDPKTTDPVVDPKTTDPVVDPKTTDPVVDPKTTDPVVDPKTTDPVVDPAPPAPRAWADLRTDYAKGDEKLAKRLARYSSTEAALDALIAAQNKIAAGGVKTPLPDKATPEQIAEWRADNGIPETPDAYDISVPADLELSEEQEATVRGFLEAAHEVNMTPAQVERQLNYLFEAQAAQAEARAEADVESRLQTEEALRMEWGPEYRMHINMVTNLLEGAPADLKEDFMAARMPDGTAVFNDPRMLRWMANMAREINPAATLVPPGGDITTVTSEIAKIEALMGDRESTYWKGPEAAAMQQKYVDLVDAQSKMKKRA